MDASANGRQQRMPSFMRFPPSSALSSSVDESESLIHRKNKNLELLIFFVFLLLSWLSSIAKAVVEILNVCAIRAIRAHTVLTLGGSKWRNFLIVSPMGM